MRAHGFLRPRDEDELRQLVVRAWREGRTLRVRGAGHSVREAIYGENGRPRRGGSRDMNVLLDRMRAISWDEAARRVTVQGGCNLGRDPSDPTRTSTIENSLFYQLDQRGWALPNTGGITHQTTSGFVSTGSSGGSLRHSVGDQIVALRLVDGTGTVREVSADESPEEFAAAGVSMGLLGVVTSVTFQCVDRFDVIGHESIQRVEDSDIDLFGNGTEGRPSLERFFRDTEYARLFWWPQRKVERVVIWRGRRMGPGDYNDVTGPPASFRPRPYQMFPRILGTDWPAQLFGSAFYHGAWSWNTDDLLGKATRGALALKLSPMIRLFSSLDGRKGPQAFWDRWWRALPMDNQVRHGLYPTEFTEMWFPLSQAAEAMRRLRDHFRAGGVRATGTYACEIYATKRSRFWLSPGYERDAVKIDLFWFGRHRGNPVESFYPKFWRLLEDLEYRLHWGKYLRPDAATYLRPLFPKWDDFMAVRERFDPGGVFLTDYWARHLGIGRGR